MIEIKHHGATSGVTGSCHELSLPSDEPRSRAGVLIDCGLFQGSESKGRSTAEDLAIDFSIDHIRALVVTHVHIDHVGRIPYLLAAGFEGPIICSEPSAVMLPEILEDALKIGFTRDRRLIERVLAVIRERLVPVPYNQWHPVFDKTGCSLSVRLQRAGHILGSAYVECDARSGELEERVVFSGDLGAPHSPLLPEPSSPERADRLVIESTYGDKNHEDRETRRYPLSFEQLTVINSHDDHLNAVEYLAKSHRPCVVLAGSGMCAGGRVVNYLKAMLGNERNDVLFVGYQAVGTPGRDILTHGPIGGWVELEGKRYDIRAKIHQVSGYSAHAGQADLLRFVEGISVPPKEIRIVHGDSHAKQEFDTILKARLPNSRVCIP